MTTPERSITAPNSQDLSYSQYVLATVGIPVKNQVITQSTIDKATQIKLNSIEKQKNIIPHFFIYSSFRNKITSGRLPSFLHKLISILAILVDLILFIIEEPYRFFKNRSIENQYQNKEDALLSQIKNEQEACVARFNPTTPLRLSIDTPTPSEPHKTKPSELLAEVNKVLKDQATPQKNVAQAEVLSQSIYIIEEKAASDYADVALKKLAKSFDMFSWNHYNIHQSIFQLLIKRQQDRAQHSLESNSHTNFDQQLLDELQKQHPNIDYAHLKYCVFRLSHPCNFSGLRESERTFNLFLSTMHTIQDLIEKKTFIKEKKTEILSFMKSSIPLQTEYSSSSSSTSSSLVNSNPKTIETYFQDTLNKMNTGYTLQVLYQNPKCPQICDAVSGQTHIDSDQCAISLMYIDPPRTTSSGHSKSSHVTEKLIDFPLQIEYKESQKGPLIIRFTVTIQCSLKEHVLSATLKNFSYPDV